MTLDDTRPQAGEICTAPHVSAMTIQRHRRVIQRCDG
jgi:hypothetical protein